MNEHVVVSGGPLVAATEVEALLGWALTPEGLCRGDTCVIVPDGSSGDRDGAVDITAIAALLDRPAVVDEPSGMVAIGVPRGVRRAALHDLEAPDFVLPDLDGTPHSLSDHRSKKRLLVAFSSW